MSDWLRDAAVVGLGGFFGSAGRFLLGGWVAARAGSFPYGTLTVNVIGSLVIGFLAPVLADRVTASPAVRLLVMAGFLGGFTTFSAFSYESLQLWHEGRWAAMLANIGLNVCGCLLAGAAGMAVSRALMAAES